MITITGLQKRFGKLAVLRGIDLNIAPGKVTAIVGPNGSGKTTLIKTLLGLVRPDSGTISLAGVSLNGDPSYREMIGYMPQAGKFPENLTVSEVLRLVKDVRRHSGPLDEALFEQFQLAESLNKPIRTLSGGTRQKLSATIAFLFRPEILILDEPTAGLDPVASAQLKDKICRERDGGRTVILTSHIMSEIEALSDILVYLQDGKVFYNGTLAAMIHSSGETRLERAIARLMEGGDAA